MSVSLNYPKHTLIDIGEAVDCLAPIRIDTAYTPIGTLEVGLQVQHQ